MLGISSGHLSEDHIPDYAATQPGPYSDHRSDKDPPLPAYSQPSVPHLHTDNQKNHHSRGVPSNSSDYVIVGSQNQSRRGQHEYYERDRVVHNGNGRSDPYYYKADDSRSSSPTSSSHSRTTARRSGIFIFILAISLVLCLVLCLALALPILLKRPRGDICDPETRERVREEWQKERNRWDRERAAWEEEWERRRSAYHWTYPNPGARCLAYGEREWTAELITNNEQANVEVACYATSIEIRGMNMSTPDVCTNVGGWGKVKWQGHWKVRNDPVCKTYWEEWQDKGCTNPGSGIRRINARLSNLRGGDDGSIMCATTPASYNGRILVGDQSCEDWGSRRGSWHGIWDIEDLSSCRPNKLAAANTNVSLETATALMGSRLNT